MRNSAAGLPDLSPQNGESLVLRRLLAWLGRPRQKLAVVALLFSFLCHAAVFVAYASGAGSRSVDFVTELLFCVAVAATCSAGTFVVEHPAVLLTLHGFRFLAVGVATRILGGTDAMTEVMLITPYLVEGCLYAGVAVGSVLGGALVIASATADLLIPSAVPMVRRALNSSIVAFLGAAATALSALVVHYREKAVEDAKRISDLNAAVSNLSDANLAFQSYASRVGLDSATTERNRVTRELHDTVGYALTSVIMTMDAARVLAEQNPSELPELFRTTRNLADQALAETRRTLYRLRSIVDSPLNGLPAVAHLGKSFQAATGVKVELHYGNLPVSLGGQIDSAIYRLVQEGLTNAFKHGKATFVRVTMSRGDAEVRVHVWNDGRGATVLEEGIGLKGMRERFTELGGSLTTATPGDGFELRAVVPYRPL
jgi:signal transduction histidine kinase